MFPTQLVRRYFQQLISVAVFLLIVFSYYYLPSSRNLDSDKVIIRNNSSSEINQTNKRDTNFSQKKPWFYTQRTEVSSKINGTHMLNLSDVRVLKQLKYIPENYSDLDTPVKVILSFYKLKKWDPTPETAFVGCPVNKCMLTIDKKRAVDADAIIFRDPFESLDVPRYKNQIWIMLYLETFILNYVININYLDVFNWTETYRRDSTLSIPYYRWIYYDPEIHAKPQTINYAANKTKKVAWFVSNCWEKNQRQDYVYELSKFIPVDIYGECDSLSCSHNNKTCFQMLQQDYKFYLAFENIRCREFITEKLYVNGLENNVVPIVMGAHPKDYERDAPQASYIHVDEFAGPKELASYLHRLDQDDELYNKYFKWKGTGEIIESNFWCRLCAMMHAPLKYKYVDDLQQWYRDNVICTEKAWRSI